MIINHNMSALGSYRQLGINNANMAKSTEKLSSGLRINRAGDDAAGLAISEKMRGQIRGLEQASRNAQDSISLIQTAEGALNETHSILQRMRELAVQASNGTATDDDRKALQDEVKQLKDEIDRIGNTTEFNTMKLIDGSVGAKTVAGTNNAAVVSDALGKQTAGKITGTVDFNNGANKIANTTVAIDTIDQTIKIDGADITFRVSKSELDAVAYDTTGAKFAELLQDKINKGVADYNTKYDQNVGNITVSASGNKISITSGTVGGSSTISVTAAAAGANNLWEIAGMTVGSTTANTGSEGIVDEAGAGKINALKAAAAAGSTVMNINVDGTDIKLDLNSISSGAIKGLAAQTANTNDLSATAAALQTDINQAIADYNKTVPSDKKVENVKVTVKDGALVVESGSKGNTSSVKFDNSTAAQLLGLANANSATQGGGLKFQIGANQGQDMQVTIEDMRVDALGLKNVDISSKAGADEAITTIQNAITKVSTQRSALGAFQNRLEHTINNLNTSAENLTAAESRIRDTDMAKTVMENTKNSILAQAAQAMLAQANQNPQQVLQLLR